MPLVPAFTTLGVQGTSRDEAAKLPRTFFSPAALRQVAVAGEGYYVCEGGWVVVYRMARPNKLFHPVAYCPQHSPHHSSTPAAAPSSGYTVTEGLVLGHAGSINGEGDPALGGCLHSSPFFIH